MKNLPKKLLSTKNRAQMWKSARQVIGKLEKQLPIKSIYLRGSFTTKKRRPADVDFIILLKTTSRKNSNWSVDFVVCPDNKYGDAVADDASKWMRQKYGAKNSAFIKLK